MKTYREAMDYLLEIPMFSQGKTPQQDLKRYLKALGNPEQGKKIIHVAGTNGKGSVCAFLTSILIEGRKNVGTFTSPHLIEINERIAINGDSVDNKSFLDGFIKVYELLDRLPKKGFHSPTFFEFLFLMAMVIFQEKSVEYIILETGLGGRLDATNVIAHPLISIITSISLDHVKILGSTIGEIAAEKAGIIKTGIPVIYDGSDSEAAEVISRTAKEKHTSALSVNRENFQILSLQEDFLEFCANTLRKEKQKFQIPCAGDYQVMNSMLAVRAIEVTDRDHEFSWDIIIGGLRKFAWPGRMEQVRNGVYLDGAHNPGAVRAFVDTAKKIIGKNTGKLYVLFSTVADKDYRAMAKEICCSLKPEAVVLTQIGNSRGLPVKILEQTFSEFAEKEIITFKNVEEAVDAVLKMKAENDKVFCVGSLYLVGAVKTILRRKQDD